MTMAAANTLVYYKTAAITAVKSVTVQTAELSATWLFWNLFCEKQHKISLFQSNSHASSKGTEICTNNESLSLL